MANPKIEDWLNKAPGRIMNPDGAYGYQCVDLADQYAEEIFGVPWGKSMGWVTGARQLLDVSPDEFWVRTDNNPADPNQVPQRGDMVVFRGNGNNPWGHVAVVLSADTNGMNVVQQDGFAPPHQFVNGAWYSAKPAHQAYLPYDGPGTGPLAGWLTPRANKILGYTPPAPVTPALSDAQRVVVKGGAKYRPEPNTDKKETQLFNEGDILNFDGYVHGQEFDGNNIWFRGALTKGFVWSGGVTPKEVGSLPLLTPPAPEVPALSATQRVVVKGGAKYRPEPNTDKKETQLFNEGDILNFDGYVHGQEFDGNNIWFRGALTKGFVWSGGVTPREVGSLPNLTPKPVEPPKPPVYTPPVIVAPKPVPAPVAAPVTPEVPSVTPVTLSAEFSSVTEVSPAHPDNYLVGGLPEKPTHVAIHQFGAKGTKISSVKSWFGMSLADRKKGTPSAGPSSAHFSVEDDSIVQHVSVKERGRAYHSGRVGNNYVGIETSPDQSAKTIASVRKLMRELNDFYGYELIPILHQSIPENATECGSFINLDDYKNVGLTPKTSDKPIKEQITSVLSELTKLIGKL